MAAPAFAAQQVLTEAQTHAHCAALAGSGTRAAPGVQPAAGTCHPIHPCQPWLATPADPWQSWVANRTNIWASRPLFVTPHHSRLQRAHASRVAQRPRGQRARLPRKVGVGQGRRRPGDRPRRRRRRVEADVAELEVHQRGREVGRAPRAGRPHLPPQSRVRCRRTGEAACGAAGRLRQGPRRPPGACGRQRRSSCACLTADAARRALGPCERAGCATTRSWTLACATLRAECCSCPSEQVLPLPQHASAVCDQRQVSISALLSDASLPTCAALHKSGDQAGGPNSVSDPLNFEHAETRRLASQLTRGCMCISS